MHPPIPHKALKLSRKVDQCKPLGGGSGSGGGSNQSWVDDSGGSGSGGGGGGDRTRVGGRGFHSFTLELNLCDSNTHSRVESDYKVDSGAQVEL
jgi:hypothetical protein